MSNDTDTYATRRAVADCGAIGAELPPIRQAVLDELDAAISGLQVALDYCRGNAAQRQRVRRATGRLRTAAVLRPEIQPALQQAIDRLDDALDCIGWIGCGTVQTAKDEVQEVKRQVEDTA